MTKEEKALACRVQPAEEFTIKRPIETPYLRVGSIQIVNRSKSAVVYVGGSLNDFKILIEEKED